MKSLLNTAMQQGAIGLSSGLYYVPGAFEIPLALKKAVNTGKFDGIH